MLNPAGLGTITPIEKTDRLFFRKEGLPSSQFAMAINALTFACGM
jgi:hypothetical protein